MRHLLPLLPNKIAIPRDLIDKLYSDEVLDFAERKKLVNKFKEEGAEEANRLLIDMLLDKPDDKIHHFMLILREMPEQENLANEIQEEADKWKGTCLQNMFTSNGMAAIISTSIVIIFVFNFA